MRKPRVALDTNILVSGLVFRGGSEHRILRRVEDGSVDLVLPESVIVEARKVFAEKFQGFESLLDIFLESTKFEVVPMNQILSAAKTSEGKVSDSKDITFYVAVEIAKPDYAVTGDRALREDLRRSRVSQTTKVCKSREFLNELGGLTG
jgi:predicted nucleic acid-binding protein